MSTERLTLEEVRTINQAAAYFDIGLQLEHDRKTMARKLFAIAGNPMDEAPTTTTP